MFSLSLSSSSVMRGVNQLLFTVLVVQFNCLASGKRSSRPRLVRVSKRECLLGIDFITFKVYTKHFVVVSFNTIECDLNSIAAWR